MTLAELPSKLMTRSLRVESQDYCLQ